MRKILFVDDDHKVTKELKKMMHPMNQVWEMEFAASGKEALNFMAKSPSDVLVSDMHMPEMDGVELLNTIKERYPETIRIILSERSDKEKALRSIKSVHQLLTKPYNAEAMKYTIERACRLRDLLRNEGLKKIVARIKDLPSLPKLYNLIVSEMQSPDASIREVGNIISQDVSMSAKILQLVNSALFDLAQNINDPQHAAAFLGIDRLKAFILSIHVFSEHKEDADSCGFSLAEMWRHSLRTSKLARDIVRTVTADRSVAEEAMIAGMLHDIGKLILLKVPIYYKKVMDFMKQTGCDHVEAAYSVLKTSHAELGAYLLGFWGIPHSIIEPVAFHHNPSKLLEDIFIMPGESSNKDSKPRSLEKYSKGFAALTAVHVANALMIQGNISSDTTSFPYIDMMYLRKFNLTHKLTEWVELYKDIMQQEVVSYV